MQCSGLRTPNHRVIASMPSSVNDSAASLDNGLCSKLSLSTQVYKRVPATHSGSKPCDGLASNAGESNNTLCSSMSLETGISSGSVIPSGSFATLPYLIFRQHTSVNKGVVSRYSSQTSKH